MILAIDPGIAMCGWAVVRPPAAVIALGVIATKVDPGMIESTDRATRIHRQAAELGAIAKRYKVAAIAAEAMSFGGSPAARFRMAISLGLSWGALVALAVALGVELLELPPKQWQHAIQPEAGDDAVDYDVVFRRLHRFAMKQCAVQLRAIAKSKRNHALDAVGVGLYAALRPSSATQIGAT